MANDPISTRSSPFERAAANIAAKRIEPAKPKEERRTSAQIRASLNQIPDADTLSSMIDRALGALSRGVRWARGSILNLLV